MSFFLRPATRPQVRVKLRLLSAHEPSHVGIDDEMAITMRVFRRRGNVRPFVRYTAVCVPNRGKTIYDTSAAAELNVDDSAEWSRATSTSTVDARGRTSRTDITRALPPLALHSGRPASNHHSENVMPKHRMSVSHALPSDQWARTWRLAFEPTHLLRCSAFASDVFGFNHAVNTVVILLCFGSKGGIRITVGQRL